MKKSFLILFALLTTTCFSQGFFSSYEEGKITFRDGKEVDGLIKLAGLTGDKVKFKKTKNSKKTLYSEKELKKIKFQGGSEFVYKIKGTSVGLYKRVKKGKLELYSYVTQSPGLMTPNGMMMSVGTSNVVYLIGKSDSDFIEKLPGKRRKKFREIFRKFTADCPLFQEKLKSKKSVKEFFKYNSRTEINMVHYYNYHCKDSKLENKNN